MLIKLRLVELLYQFGFGLIFEAIPKPVYGDSQGRMYMYDYHRTKKKRTPAQELEDVLRADNILMKTLAGRLVFENDIYLGLEDRRGNFYRFKKLERLKEWERRSLGLHQAPSRPGSIAFGGFA